MSKIKELKLLVEFEDFKVGDKVNTPAGSGIITDINEPGNNVWVKLDNTSQETSFWIEDVEKITNES